jgi:D-alanyl-D-alanine carboxypeptidase
MLSVLASVLVLGLIPPEPPAAPAASVPGIEILSIAAPDRMAATLQMPEISASGAILIDVLSGQEIFSINPDERRPMASLTKIMTALLILENHDLDEYVTIPPIAEEVKGSTIDVVTGQRFSVRSLLYALLLPSANDAAYALAVHDGRSVGAFVQRMNDRAKSLGLKNTHFANPAGLDHPEQYSTPRDLAWLTLAALKNSDFATIVGTRTARITATDGKEFSLKNTNEMLHYNANVFGVKTGTTDNAGECLIILFTENDHPYLFILLGSSDRYADGLKKLQAVHAALQ